MTAGWRIGLGALILAATVPPPLAAWWEAGMVRHMLGQIPLLVLAGVLIAPRGTGQGPGAGADPLAIAAVLVAVFCLLFWMIPRWLDAAVGDGRVDAAKIASLVLLAGILPGWAWPRLGLVARAFVWVHVATMFGTLGILYRIAPDRLCTSYLVSEQEGLGFWSLVVAGVMVALGTLAALSGRGLARSD
ncbi:MAG: hypothetical protein IT542_10485 [Rubellimicrobium sp.]|nr:hypothetical protein [Rubellimicrobium sp.]